MSGDGLKHMLYAGCGRAGRAMRRALVRLPGGRPLCLAIERGKRPLFTSVEIETTSVCNRSCSYCPNYTETRKAGRMDSGLFRKIIDELSELNYSGRFSPHFYGEPLLDKRLAEFISYTRSKLPGAFIKLFTNGDLLDQALFTRLMTAGVDVMRISQHDDRPVENVSRLLAGLDDRMRSRVEHVRYFNNDDALMNRGGLVAVKHDVKMAACDYVSGVTIDYEGNVILCCQDYRSAHVFGNLKSRRLVDVWNDKRYKALRDNLRCGIWSLEICRICNGLSAAAHGKK